MKQSSAAFINAEQKWALASSDNIYGMTAEIIALLELLKYMLQRQSHHPLEVTL
jgi:uncharacterized membrane protein